MKWLDSIAQTTTRKVARRSSRRGFLATVSTLLLGATATPLLPVARASRQVRISIELAAALGPKPPPIVGITILTRCSAMPSTIAIVLWT